MDNRKSVVDCARNMFIARRQITDIARTLGITRNTIYRWADQFGWNNLKNEDPPLEVAKRRLAGLLEIENKNDENCAEIELLTGVVERLEKLEQQDWKNITNLEKIQISKREKGKPRKKII